MSEDFKCLKCGAHGKDVLGKDMLCGSCCRYNENQFLHIELIKNIMTLINVSGVQGLILISHHLEMEVFTRKY